MNEQKVKVTGRNVAIALGIICIILAVGLVGSMVNYTMVTNNKDATYRDYTWSHSHSNSDYDSLHNAYQNYVATHSYSNAEYDAYVANHHYTDAEYNYLGDIVNLAKSSVWVDDETISQPASSYTTWTPTFSASYAGYVSVWVQTSTTTNTYVRVIYSAYGVNYDHQIGVGTGGTAVFPVLPSSTIEIRVGNSNLFSGATETVTITFHY